MHFHDTRHTHKTWLIEDDIPEIAQARRLGHRLPRHTHVYSHVTPIMIARITNSLEARWRAGHEHAQTTHQGLHAA
jgi:integrase